MLLPNHYLCISYLIFTVYLLICVSQTCSFLCPGRCSVYLMCGLLVNGLTGWHLSTYPGDMTPCFILAFLIKNLLFLLMRRRWLIQRCVHKGDVTRNNSQWQFLAPHSIAIYLRHCFKWFQHCSNIATLCCAKNCFFLSESLSSHAISRQKHLELPVISHLLIELFYIGMPVMQTDGRTGVRSRDYQKKIIKFS